MKTYVVAPHWNCLGQTVLMMRSNIRFKEGRNIRFKRAIWKIIPKLSLFLSRALRMLWFTMINHRHMGSRMSLESTLNLPGFSIQRCDS